MEYSGMIYMMMWNSECNTRFCNSVTSGTPRYCIINHFDYFTEEPHFMLFKFFRRLVIQSNADLTGLENSLKFELNRINSKIIDNQQIYHPKGIAFH
jgi:hypothetical protein